MNITLLYWRLFEPYKYHMFIHYLSMWNDKQAAFNEVKERYEG